MAFQAESSLAPPWYLSLLGSSNSQYCTSAFVNPILRCWSPSLPCVRDCGEGYPSHERVLAMSMQLCPFWSLHLCLVGLQGTQLPLYCWMDGVRVLARDNRRTAALSCLNLIQLTRAITEFAALTICTAVCHSSVTRQAFSLAGMLMSHLLPE